LYLLGSFQVTLDGTSVTEFRSDKVRALLTYLALEADRPHRRDALAGLLWPDVPDATARNNLRQSLHRLRQAISDTDSHPAFLHVTPETVQFISASDDWLDVTASESRRAPNVFVNQAVRHLRRMCHDYPKLNETASIVRGVPTAGRLAAPASRQPIFDAERLNGDVLVGTCGLPFRPFCVAHTRRAVTVARPAGIGA
jgi:hypothetical protein